MNDKEKLFSIRCKYCGSPVGFDISSQSYRCTYCGQISQTKDARIAWRIPDLSKEQDIQIHSDDMICPNCGATAHYHEESGAYQCDFCGSEISPSEVRELEWRKLNSHNWDKVQHDELVAECTVCGARVIFQKEDASETCQFCGSHLVQSTLYDKEELPEYIIPFVLTEEEAQNRLSAWVKEQKDSKDARRVGQNIKQMKGYYLPYCMIRGSLEGIAYRDQASREFHYRGFLDYALVNASGQMDNQILDAAEPFDLSALRPFEPGYIGGHRVKLRDISDAAIGSRTKEEAAERYRPYVANVLHNNDVRVQVDSGDFMKIPVLLPVYVQKVGKYMAVVNGQTGKVAAASSEKKRESKAWLIEPTILTVLAVLITGYFFSFMLYPMLLFGVIAALVFYTAYGQDRNAVLLRKIYQGKSSSAKRTNGNLELNDGDELLKNAFPNTPVFYEKEGNREVRVEMKFYTPGRVFAIVFRMLVLVLLPVILASVIQLISGNGIESLTALPWGYGAAWYVTAGGIAIIYWIRGVRWALFNHPILYEVLPNGERRLFGSRKSRSLSIFSLFGVEHLGALRELGGMGLFIVLLILFLLVGSTLAILF